MKEAPPQKKGENIFGGPRLRQKKKSWAMALGSVIAL